MSQYHCQREHQVRAAIRVSNYDPEILDHACACPVCSEVLITKFLEAEMQLANHEFASLPDAGLVWRKAQARAREQATVRAMRPIQLARICAFVVAVFAALWFIFGFHQLPHWTINLEFKAAMSGITASVSNFSILSGMIATLVCIALSSWYILREE